MKVLVNGAWIDKPAYSLQSGNWVAGGECYVRTAGVWVSGSCTGADPGGELEFTQHPLSQQVEDGAGFTFTVAATGYTGLQWQVHNGTAWADLTGETSLTYTSTGAIALHGYQYRCRATDGTSTIYSNAALLTIGSCTPLLGAAAEFLRIPTEHERDGLVMETLAAADPDGVFPDGPRPFIGAFRHYTYEMASWAEAGFTVIYGSYSGMATIADITAINTTGMKYVALFRNHDPAVTPPSASGIRGMLAKAGHAGPTSSYMQDLETANKNYVDYVYADSTARDTVIGFAFHGDDALSNDPHSCVQYGDGRSCSIIVNEKTYSCCDTGEDWSPGRRVDYWKWAKHMFPTMSDYIKTKWGKPLLTCDLPGNNVDYDSLKSGDIKLWMQELSIWAGQRYWGYATPVSSSVETWWSRAYLWHYAYLYMKLNKEGNLTAPSDGKHRLTGPIIWSQGYYAANEIPTFRNIGFYRRSIISTILINLLAGSTSTLAYQMNNGQCDLTEWKWVVSFLTSNNIFKALLWGEEKAGNNFEYSVTGDIDKVIIDNPTCRYVLQDCLSLDNSNCQDDEIGTSTTRYRDMDAILWKAVQFQDRRYLIVTSLQKHPDEHNHSGYDTVGPVPTNYTIRSKFTLPTSLTGVQCRELVSGDLIDITSGEIECTLAPISSAIYVFEPAPGWCSIDYGTGFPTISAITQSPDPAVWNAELQLSVAIADADSWVWEFDKHDGNGFQDGGQANELIYNILIFDLESIQQWDYRVVADNANGQTISTIFTCPDVSPAGTTYELTQVGDHWAIDNQSKLLLGGVRIGEPFFYKQQYSDHGLSITDDYDWLGDKLTWWAQHKVNFFRCTIAGWQTPYAENGSTVVVAPFNGYPQSFDLDSINQNFFDRLDALLYRFEEIGGVVNVELFDPHWCQLSGVWLWDSTQGGIQPDTSMWWNPKHVSAPSAYANLTNDHVLAAGHLSQDIRTVIGTTSTHNNDQFTLAARNGNPATPAASETDPILKAQKLFVDAACEVVRKHTNALIQIENESFEPNEWDEFWAQYINNKGYNILVCTMKGSGNLYDSDVRLSLTDSDFHYADNSQATGIIDMSSTQGQDTLFAKMVAFNSSNANAALPLKPVNATKVYSRNGYDWGHPENSLDCFFIALLAGNAGCAFHPGTGITGPAPSSDGAAGLGDSQTAMDAVVTARIMDNICTMSELSPVSNGDTTRWVSRPSHKAFAAGNGNYYVIYIADDLGNTRFDNSPLTGTFYYMWIDVENPANRYTSITPESVGNIRLADLTGITATRRILIMSSTDLS